MTLKSDAKFKKKISCGLENDMSNMANFHQKSQNRDFDGIPFIRRRKCISLKLTEELCVMTMKNYEKFEEELTCRLKIDMRNLTNFEPITQKSQKFAL